MGTFWSYFLEFFGLTGLRAQTAAGFPAPALGDARSEDRATR
jgi:hypothetical protein